MLTGIRDDVALCRRWARFYASRGFNPLPSRRDAKRPLVRFARWWEEPAPVDLFDRHPTTNLQIMTGSRWRLVVIDVDGPDARRWLAGLDRPVPPTWATHSGGDGLHLWFLLPEGFRGELPRAILWRGEGRHAAVERLGDRSLIVAPPSIHPTTGHRYRFLGRSQSPARLPMPARCPDWLLRLPAIATQRPVAEPGPARLPMPARKMVTRPGRYRTAAVLDAIRDKISLASSWGLRVASGPNHAGWCRCHAVGREDRTPSASISAESGRYWEPGARSIGLFDLGVQLGVYADWRDAVADLGARFGAREGVR
jgi:hypothetical protein